MVRAAAYDRHMAASLGVPVQHVYAGAFAFGVALAGLAGVLLAPIYSVFPTMGRDFILMAFTVVIVGGMGSIAGVVVAGLLLTQVQAIVSLYHLAGLVRSDRVRDHGGDADGAAAGPVRPARPWLTRSPDRCGRAMCSSAVLVAASLVFAAIGAAMNDTFYLRLATEALIFAGLALSVDILLGYTGLLSLGQALYFRARRLSVGAGADGGTLVLGGFRRDRGRLRRRRTGRRLHRAARARGLFRAHHFRHGAGRRQGGLQHPRARRLRRTDRRSRSSTSISASHRCRAPRRPASSCSCSRSSSFFYALSAYLLDTPFGRLLIALRANEAAFRSSAIAR